MVRRLRAEGEQDVAQLTSAVDEAGRVAAGRPVLQLELELDQLEPARAASAVIRVSTPKPAATGKQTARAAGERNRCPESGSRALEAGGEADERPRNALGDPEAAALPAGERGDSEVGAGGGERPQVAAQVGVAEEDRPGAAPRARRASAPGPCRGAAGAARVAPASSAASAVASVEPSSATTIARLREEPPQLAHGPADPLRLVARGNEDGEGRSATGAGAGSGSIGGRMPSSAVSRTP